MSEKSYTCPKCGLTIPRFAGPVPTECPACMPAKNRARAIDRLRKHSPELAEEIEARIASAGPGADDEESPEMKAALRAAAPMLLALAMSMVKKPAEAAELAGLSVLAEEDPDWFKGVVRAARRNKPLVEAQPAAIGGIIQAAIGRLVLRAWTHADRISPAQAATTARALAQVAELIQGGAANKVHTEIELVFPSEVVHRTVEEVREAEGQEE